MVRYNQEQLNEMAEQIDIVDYISQTEELVRKGNNYFCCCPFHANDDTPSLCIYPDTNKWYCFGCGAGSSIYDWMMKHEGLTFPEAVEKVGNLTNSNINEIIESESMTFLKEVKKIKQPKNILTTPRKILDWNKDYLEKYSDEIPEEWVSEGMTNEALKIFHIRIDNNANRIVYPVMDSDNNFIGVKGRTRFENYKELGLSKYINYQKIGTIDYFQGWQQALPYIQQQRQVIIFEGIKSSIKTWDWDIRNTVSSETAALSDGQLRLLIKSGIPEVVIAWDYDQKLNSIINDSKIKMLKKFTSVSVIIDTKKRLQEKDAPADRGELIFRELLKEKIKI